MVRKAVGGMLLVVIDEVDAFVVGVLEDIGPPPFAGSVFIFIHD